MMEVFHLALLQVVGKAHIMVRREQQAGAFAVEPFADGGDFLWRRLLLERRWSSPNTMSVSASARMRSSIGSLKSCLVDALKDGDGVAGHLFGELLEAESGAMK